jgi:hypothetical protein
LQILQQNNLDSNKKDEGGCDGDDELTDAEGLKMPLIPAMIRSRLNGTGAMPARQVHQISAIMDNTSWSHLKGIL